MASDDLPAPADVWRVIFDRAKVGTRVRIPDTTPQALHAAFRSATTAIMSESTDGTRSFFVCSPGQDIWHSVTTTSVDEFMQTADIAHRAIAVCGGAADHVVSIVHLEYHTEMSVISRCDIEPFEPRSLLEPTLFRHSSYGDDEYIITYVPLSMSRRVRRHGRASHDDVGAFKFDVIRAIANGAIEGVESKFNLDDETIFFLHASASESIRRVDALVPPLGVEPFLLFAAHALRETFVANITLQWVWVYDETRCAIRQLRAMQTGCIEPTVVSHHQAIPGVDDDA